LSSWDNNEEQQYDFNEPNSIPEDSAFDSQHMSSFLLEGSACKRRKEQRLSMRRILIAIGWHKDYNDSIPTVTESIKPVTMKTSAEWKAETIKYRQSLLDKEKQRNENISPITNVEDTNIVKIVDKSYLQKSYHAGETQAFIEKSINQYTLNTEQERAFRIIANHASNPHAPQLKMYVAGMGGTGKSQVLKALSYFFELRNEAYRFVVVAPTGAAASLLGGSTYHYMFGINEHSGTLSNLAKVRSRLAGVDYVFFDEVSMLSARDLYKISYQLAHTFNKSDIPFGGMNMVFCGDFAQLPPVPGGESKSLYSHTIGALGTTLASQEEAIGKALWHQITTVIILRQNMRQKTQSEKDAKLRTALENMRYKACTVADLDFLHSLVSSNLPGRASVTDKNFRNVPIITALNIHKDEINAIGAARFARETGQELVNFYSEDSISSRNYADRQTIQKGRKKTVKISEVSNELQEYLWEQTPSENSMKIAGKLPLCIGMPVMIRNNFATELCITRGQEGYVCGWQSKLGSKNQLILDTLFVKLSNPPKTIQFNDLPQNVVPIPQTSTSIEVSLPNDTSIRILRSQVETSLNFSMTDYASQGKTRSFNVVDLHNLRTHQAYYTAISRSSSADGTLILQGFDPSKITGKISGALRQEFRELELLDDITEKHYCGKTLLLLGDHTRNSLIKAYRETRGVQYVPALTHKAIHWNKNDPLMEGEIHDIKWHIAKDFKKNDNDANQLSDNIQHKRKHNSIRTPEKPHGSSKKLESPPHKINRVSVTNNNNTQYHNSVPLGFIWSNNSCAYDSVLTILYYIWVSDNTGLKERFSDMNNILGQILQQNFQSIDNNQQFERFRDTFRKSLEEIDSRNHSFGRMAAVHSLLEHLLTTERVTSRVYYRCSNEHTEIVHDDFSGFLNSGTLRYNSIQQWIDSPNWRSNRRCRSCNNTYTQTVSYIDLPKIIAFDIVDKSTTIDSTISVVQQSEIILNYRLMGIIYFGDMHFVSRVIRPDGQVWFHDGMSTGRNLIYQGNLNSHETDLSAIHSKTAHSVIYCRV
jgi:hypothetical protein